VSAPVPPAGHSPEWSAVVYLLRHAETEWSASGKHTSRTDVPLTPRGEERAVRLGELLLRLRGPDAPRPSVLSSPRTRALRTAELAGLRTPMVLDDLAEWEYGEYEGLTTPQIRESVPGWTVWTHPAPGGEPADAVTARADRVLEAVEPLRAQGDVVLVGHGHFSRVLAARWLELPATSGRLFVLGPASPCLLGHEHGRPAVHRWNVPNPAERDPG
jgi:broad specificity phosphatase PhoE